MWRIGSLARSLSRAALAQAGLPPSKDQFKTPTPLPDFGSRLTAEVVNAAHGEVAVSGVEANNGHFNSNGITVVPAQPNVD